MDPQLFISYAHADDQAFDEDSKGWVTLFVDKLQKAIAMKAGGSKVRVWMDHRLEPQRAVDDTLRQCILGSRCILAFLSPRYLESIWCGQEMATFVELIGGGKSGNRVFLVELLPTDRDHWHPGIQSITALKFWSTAIDEPEAMTLGWPIPNPKSDKAYWRELNNLAAILARQIQALPPSTPSSSGSVSTPAPATPSPSAPASSAAPCIWIADPGDDVLDAWEDLRHDLEQNGCRVLPEVAGHYPMHDEASFRQALARDLRQADLLLQLLGKLPGKKPVWSSLRFVRIQADAAKLESLSRNIQYWPWRLPDIEVDQILDPDFKGLLGLATSENFKAFRRKVFDHLNKKAIPTMPEPAGTLSVVINADEPDRDLGKKAQDLLDRLDVVTTLAALPQANQLPAKYFHDLDSQYENHHGVLIVYGATPPSWVQSQHARAHKLLAQRKGVWGALLDGPPEQKDEHGIRNRNLMILDCRGGLRADPLKGFVDCLRAGLRGV